MTNEEALAYFIDNIEQIITAAKDENMYNYETQQIEYIFMRRDFEAKEVAIKALKQTIWIPVSERLPEEGKSVLVWYRYWRYGDYNDWCYTYGIGYQIDGNWGIIDGGDLLTVYAWMQPPEPYEAESEDKK